MVIAGLALSYLAWFGLYHAHPRRSAYALLSKPKGRSQVTRGLSLMLMLLALLPCWSIGGLERGIALWVALLVCAGTVFVFTLHISEPTNKNLTTLSLIVLPLVTILAFAGGQ